VIPKPPHGPRGPAPRRLRAAAARLLAIRRWRACVAALGLLGLATLGALPAHAARYLCTVGNMDVPIEAASLDAANETWAGQRDRAPNGNGVLYRLPCRAAMPLTAAPKAAALPQGAQRGAPQAPADTLGERPPAGASETCAQRLQGCRAACQASGSGVAGKIAAIQCKADCEVQRGACLASGLGSARADVGVAQQPAAPPLVADAAGPAVPARKRNTQWTCGSASVDASGHSTPTMDDAKAEFRRRFEHEPTCCAPLDDYPAACSGRSAGGEVKQFACKLARDTSMFADWVDVYATNLADAHRQAGHAPGTDAHCVQGSAAKQNEARDRKRSHWQRLQRP